MDHSEVRHLPKVDHEPANLDDASRLLLKAADLIERWGLAKHTTCDEKGGMCVRGALRVAEGAKHAPHEPNFGDASAVAFEADRRLGVALGGDNPAFWNNAKERKPEEVVAKLRAVALGHGG